jgi:hypothetical protein
MNTSARRKSGAQAKGGPNGVAAELREAAPTYTALEELARLATRAKSEIARVAACRELLVAVMAALARASASKTMKQGGH